MIKKACFLVNYNQYESKRHFTEKFAEALNRNGIETKVFDVIETKIHEGIIEAIKEFRPDFTLSFNSFNPLPDNTYLWDLLQIPHLSMLLDPSLYSVGLIHSPYSVISCVDYFDCYGLATQNFDRIFLLPHAVEKELCESPDEPKEYDVVFIGSCYDYETMRQCWQNEFSESICAALDLACRIVLSDGDVPLQEALVKAQRETGFPTEGVDFLKLFTYLDKYTRGLDRVALIKSIDDAEVHIFGELFEDDQGAVKGWKDLLKDKKNVIFHKPVTYAESLSIFKKSKVCLNSNPFFKNGSHERIFAGLGAGNVLVTSENIFLKENFFTPDIPVIYSFENRKAVNEKINYYLAHEAERALSGKAGKKAVLEGHTWDHRARQLKQVMPVMIEKIKHLI